MKNNYWIEFWKEYTKTSTDKDNHTQVLRTLNKNPISENLWNFTLVEIDKVFHIKKGEKVLDLCSGNGLLSKHFVSKGASVVAVDVSKELLDSLTDIKEIETIQLDIRKLKFEANTFDNVIIYAGIQYLNNREAIQLLKNIHTWLKPGGTIFIGDIPDLNKRWDFFNSEERQKVFFDNVLNGVSIVGNWFEKSWFERLTSYLGFEEGKLITQDEELIYSNFRFDFLYKKKGC